MNTGSYINGKWVQPRSERLIRNTNPADTRDVIAEFPAATAAEVEQAIVTEPLKSEKPARARGGGRGRVSPLMIRGFRVGPMGPVGGHGTNRNNLRNGGSGRAKSEKWFSGRSGFYGGVKAYL
jgi:hypothetical protein